MTPPDADIADPRVFADASLASAADAALYAMAAQSVVAPTAQRGDELRAQLDEALAARLAGDGAALATFFDRAPSVDVARALWRELDVVWRQAVAARSGVALTVFALPIVIVVGSADDADGALSGAIADPARLGALLREHGALRANQTIAVGDTLAALDVLDLARLPEILSWHRLEPPVDHLRSLACPPLAYASGRESVHARLVVGCALAAPGVDLLDAAPRPQWALPFTRELVRQLASPGVSVLALPGPPARPLQAVRQARVSQREVAAQVFASNALRSIRSRSGEPVALLSAHRAADAPGGGELRLSLSSPFDTRDAQGFRCPLYPPDRVGDVASMLVALLRDCRVDDVRIVAGVHADRIAGSRQPLLFKPDAIPPPLH